MTRRRPGLRRLLAVGVASATALAGAVAGVGPATAAPLAQTVVATASPYIAPGQNSQAVGDLVITDNDPADANNYVFGEQIDILLDDSDGSTGPNDCVTFADVPTVTDTGTAAFGASLATTGGCTNDTLRLLVTESGTAPRIDITSIEYTVGAAAAIGAVQVNVSGTGAPAANDADASNAFITNAVLGANNPAQGVDIDAGDFAISPVTVTETTTTAADGDLCIEVESPGGPPFVFTNTAGNAPTVAVTDGNDTATVAIEDGGTQLEIDVTASATASASTFVISGLLTSTTTTGLQEVTLYAGPCDGDTTGQTALSTLTTVGFVGDIERLGGSTRYVTAQNIFSDAFGCRDWAVVARGDAFPDALAANYLAGWRGTGILLTATDTLPEATMNALRENGIGSVYVIGGPTAVSQSVVDQLDALPNYFCGGGSIEQVNGQNDTIDVIRIGGETRYDTARAVSVFPGLGNAGMLDFETTTTGCGEEQKTAIVASGENFPDALAAGPLSWAGPSECAFNPIPLMLTRPASLPSETQAGLLDLGIQQVILMGGTAAVSEAVEADIEAMGIEVLRIWGATRQLTATAMAEFLIDEQDYDAFETTFARGNDFPDALAGGAASGDDVKTLLLTESSDVLGAATADFLAGWQSRFMTLLDEDMDVYGGPSAVSEGVIDDILASLSLQ